MTTETCGRYSMTLFGPVALPSSSGSKSHPQKLSALSKRLISLSRFATVNTPKRIGLHTALRDRVDSISTNGGSTEYVQTWRSRATPSTLTYWAHTASARHTSGSGCGGWPTPKANDAPQATVNNRSSKFNPGITLVDVARMLAGWATPTAGDGSKLDTASPSAIEKRYRDGRQVGVAVQARLCVTNPSGSSTGEPRLNPAFTLWLMGFPTAWAHCAARVTPSSRRSRRNS